jgi:ribosomal-protein-alanine N-acetyltransferase
MDLTAARREIATERLLLQAGDETLAEAVADFQIRNRRHFAPWDPPTAESFYTVAAQAERIRLGLRAFAEGAGFRYWLTLIPRRASTPDGPPRGRGSAWGGPAPLDEPTRVIGSVHFSQVARGAFHNCALGYALDEKSQGRGLMHEALSAAIEEMFSPRVNLHRIQAAYRPQNKRSAAVLARLGFRPEGLARDYLFIDGAWRDHQLTALTNPAFNEPPDW